MDRHHYTPKEATFIKRHVAGRSRIELTNLFNKQRFGPPITLSQMITFIKYHHLKNGRDTRFKPGQVPHTKGKKLWYSTNGFKPGNKPWNYMPVGSERVVNGYVQVKVSDKKRKPWKRWKFKHIILWENANGKVPKGHMVTFADGNKLNLSLDNLRLISMKENAVMNKHGLRSANANLTDAGKIVADIKIAAADRKRNLPKRRRGRPCKTTQPRPTRARKETKGNAT